MEYKKQIYYSPKLDLIFVATHLGGNYYYFQSDMSGCVVQSNKHPKKLGLVFIGAL
jgi:hypothetical protein